MKNWDSEFTLARQLARPYLIGAQKAWLHNTVNLSLTGLLLIFMIMLILATHYLSWVWALTLSPLLLGWAFFVAYILIVHEASHQMYLLPGRSRVLRILNHSLPRFLSALSFQSFEEAWEQGHAQHHQSPAHQADPQNCPSFCMQGKNLLLAVLAVLFVPGQGLKKQASCTQQGSRHLLGLGAWAVIIAPLLYWYNTKAVVALILSIHVAMIFNLIKVSLEHAGRALEQNNLWLKSLSSDFPLRALVMPLNISLHFEHHLISRIPWYNLGPYHRELRGKLSPELQKDIYNLGLSACWKQISGHEQREATYV